MHVVGVCWLSVSFASLVIFEEDISAQAYSLRDVLCFPPRVHIPGYR